MVIDLNIVIQFRIPITGFGNRLLGIFTGWLVGIRLIQENSVKKKTNPNKF